MPDLVATGLDVLFVGINPSNCSGAAGLHFATPGNRFWETVYLAGFTHRRLRPDERDELLAARIGVTNLVNRATASAGLVGDAELVVGAERLRRVVASTSPMAVAVLGLGAFRKGFGRPRAGFGRQDDGVVDAPLWVLPNPSGLNASYPVGRLVEAFGELRAAIEARDD